MASLPLARASEDVLTVGARVVVLALVFLLAALVNGWPRLVPLPLVAIGGLYGAQLAVDDVPLDAAAPVVAAGLWVTAELAYWSLEERERIEAGPGEGFRRLAVVAGLALGALVVAAVPLLLVDTLRARGLTVDVLGAAAAAGALVAVVLLAHGRGRTNA